MANPKLSVKSFRKLIQSLSKKNYEKLLVGRDKANITKGTKCK